MWYGILSCAVGVVCGLVSPVTAPTPMPTQEDCEQVSQLALEIVAPDPEDASKYKIVCVKREHI
jgi:hypothetical protein